MSITVMPGREFGFTKATTQTTVGLHTSYWTIAGSPTNGATPTSTLTGEVPTSATAGAISFVNPSSGFTYVGFLKFGYITQSAVHGMVLYDRLWQNSGLNATSTSNQTINSVALTRPDANGDQVEAWWQIYTGMGGGTAGTPPTISYTDQDGNAGATGTLQQYAASLAQNHTLLFSMASGDSGVRSIQTYNNVATMVSGNAGLVLRRKICELSAPIHSMQVVADAITLGLPRVHDNAALELVAKNGNIFANAVIGNLQLIQR